MRVLFQMICLCIFILCGCGVQQAETMVLLDIKIIEVKISASKGFGGMNEDILFTFTDQQSLKVFKEAIATAVKQHGIVNMVEPEYDIMVVYESSEAEMPTHGIHLWLGEKGEKSTLMYISDDHTIYQTSPEMTDKLRELIVSDE